MIKFLGLPPFLRIALPVDMETMHFHIAQLSQFIFQDSFISHLGATDKQFGANKKLSWGIR